MNQKRIRRKPDEARQHIVDAARAALTDSDFAELTVASITERANMTRSSFYHYFSGLDELVMTLLEAFEAKIRAAVDPWLEGVEENIPNPETKTTEVFIRMYRVFLEHRNTVRIANQAAGVSKRVFEQWQVRAVDYYVDKTAEFIAREVALGNSTVDDPHRTANALILMNNALGIDSLLRSNPDDPEAIGRTAGRIWFLTIYGQNN